MMGISAANRYHLYKAMFSGGRNSVFSANRLSGPLNALPDVKKDGQKSGKAGLLGHDIGAINDEKLRAALAARRRRLDQTTAMAADYHKKARTFYDGFDPKMNALLEASYALKNTNLDSAVSPLGYGSDHSGVVTVGAKFVAGGDVFQVKVDQLASGQRTTYAALEAAQTGALAGKNKLTLASGGKTAVFDFDFAAGTTNRQALDAITATINQSGGGVKASVFEHDGESVLQLSAGDGGAFSATAAGPLDGVLKVARQEAAQSAKYSVNGIDYTSATNQIELAAGVTATLTGVGEAGVTPSHMDAGRLVSAVERFAGAYNDVSDYLKANAGLSKAVSNMAASFGDIRYRAASLAKVGLHVDASGRLSVDKSELTLAAADDMDGLKSVVGSAGGIAGMTYEKAFKALASTQNLVAPPRFGAGYYGSAKGILFDLMV